MKRKLLASAVALVFVGCGSGSGATPSMGQEAAAPMSSGSTGASSGSGGAASADATMSAGSSTGGGVPADEGGASGSSSAASATGTTDAGSDLDGVSPPSAEAGPAPDVTTTPPSDASAATGDAGVGWGSVAAILSRIVPPTFPNHNCTLTDAKYGGVGDGTTDNTAAFASAIADCAAAGGGTVVVPAGTFFTGPIELKSNINLNLAATATIKFTTDPTKYLPVVEVSFEGSLLRNYHPLVWAHDATNIAITGTGVLDGNATGLDWYAWGALAATDSLNLRTQNASGVLPATRIYGQGHYLRPSLIELMRCKNILLDGFTAKNSPFWTIHPVMSQNITGHNVTSIGSVGNTDGFDPESCVDVHLDGLKIMVGDDPIAIKAGRDRDGRTYYTPTENVVIENCTFNTNNPPHGGGISVGSEMSAGVRNVYVQNITYTSNGGSMADAIYLKASVYRGGFIENFYARNLTVASVGTFFFLNGQYSGGAVPPAPPATIAYTRFTNINVDMATVNSVGSEAFRITGADGTLPANGIHISNVAVGSGTALYSGGATHYSGLSMSNVTVAGKAVNLPASAP